MTKQFKNIQELFNAINREVIGEYLQQQLSEIPKPGYEKVTGIVKDDFSAHFELLLDKEGIVITFESIDGSPGKCICKTTITEEGHHLKVESVWDSNNLIHKDDPKTFPWKDSSILTSLSYIVLAFVENLD